MKTIKEFFAKENYYLFIFVLILVFGILLRFYNYPNRFGFDYDASRDSLVAAFYADKPELFLVGAPSSVAPFYFGPWYYYALIIFEKTFPIYGSWIFIGVISTLSIIIVYKIGEAIENKKFGLILALLVAFSTSQITLSTTLSNPSVIPLFSFLTLLFFLIATKKRKLAPVFLMGLSLGIGISTHYQMVGLIMFPILLVLFYSNRVRSFLAAFFGLIIPFVPIIIYDLLNNWYNLKGLLFYLTATHNNVYVPNRWLFYVRDFWPSFWSETLGVPTYIGLMLIAGFIFISLVLFFKKKIKLEYKLIFIAFLSNFIMLRYFPAEKPIYYLYFLQIFIFLFSGFSIYKSLDNKKTGVLSFLISFLLICFMVPGDIIKTHSAESFTKVKNYETIINRNYSGGKVTLYGCGKDDMIKAMGTSYILHKERMLAEEGVVLGFFNQSCLETLPYKLVGNSDIVTLLKTESGLSKSGWIKLSPKNVNEIKNAQFLSSY